MQIELMLGMDLVYNDEYKTDFQPSQIEYSYDIDKAVKEAYSIGKNGNIVVNNYTLLYAAFVGKDIKMQSTYNDESLNGIVDDVSAKITGLVEQPSYYI